jgi:heat shock protein HslJ
MTTRWLVLLLGTVCLLGGCDLVETLRSSEPQLTGPTWQLMTVEAPADTVRADDLGNTVTLAFRTKRREEGRLVTGNQFCNSIGGVYHVEEEQALVLDKVWTTLVGCQEESETIDRVLFGNLPKRFAYDVRTDRLVLRLGQEAEEATITFRKVE